MSGALPEGWRANTPDTTGNMATSAASSGATHASDDRHPAQWYCLLAGAALLLAGLLGFIVNTSFDLPAGDGDKLLGIFEVNGWHNVIHVLSGLVLLGASRTWSLARTAALVFGITYGIVTIIGLIDGSDVLGLIPVNPADNILHIALSLAGIAAALAPAPDRTSGRVNVDR